MKKLVHPPSLTKGNKAIIVSPSGNIDSQYVDGAKQVLESWGLQVAISPFANEKCGRFGGTPEQRLADLQSAMDDKDCQLILCSRGGYGVVQFMEKLDFTEIMRHPKWLVGFSDITALHLLFLQQGLISLHAPMARHLSENGQDEASKYLHRALFSGIKQYELKSHPLNKTGKTQGHLFGGNMAVMCSLIGTPYMKIPQKGILFIEDIAESPYKIDRMMWQLELSGILSQISGLIVGQFSDCQEDPLMGATIYESIKNRVREYDYPLTFNFPVGHVDDNYPLLHGGIVDLNVKKNIVILENKS